MHLLPTSHQLTKPPDPGSFLSSFPTSSATSILSSFPASLSFPSNIIPSSNAAFTSLHDLRLSHPSISQVGEPRSNKPDKTMISSGCSEEVSSR